MNSLPAYPVPPPWITGPLALYHGTIERHVSSIVRRIDLRRVRPRSDFGPGFYTTTIEEQAWRWASQLAAQYPGHIPAVLRFDVPRGELAGLRCLWFIRGDPGADDFWSFVVHSRLGRGPHGDAAAGGWYDVVAGPVAINWRERRIRPNSDQVSFHTPRAVALLYRSTPRSL